MPKAVAPLSPQPAAHASDTSSQLREGRDAAAVVRHDGGRGEPEAFKKELYDGAPPMLRLVLLLAVLSEAGMALVDPQIISGAALTASLSLRLVFCAVFMILFVATYVGDWARRLARPLSLLFCQLTAINVIFLAYLTGGGDSDYHEALHVTMFAYAVLPFPWKRYDATMTVLLVLASYNIVLIAGDRTGSIATLLSHNAVLGVTGLVAIAAERVIKRNMLRAFESRQALAQANERLTALDTAKTRFFSNISHELRTPLTLIVAPLEALLESSREPLAPGQRERLRLAQRNALRLLRLVDDLLSLTRAEAASLKLHITRFDLGALVQTFAQDVGELAARKAITLDVSVPAEPAFIEADSTLIERILLNVFGNAAKFVNIGGHIAMVVRPAKDGYEIAIEDNGIGISEANIAHVFDRFYQADSGATRSTGGTGIGLALVKELTELHGGRVWVDSVLGQGTTMHIWLRETLPAEAEIHAVRSLGPTDEPQGLPEWHQAIRSAKSYRLQGIDDATERRVAPRPRHRGDAPTILVVEDNPDMIRFLVALLAYDFNVLSAQNGRDGLRMAHDRRPHLNNSDVMMPEMDGFEMARQVRQDPNGARIPLIFLTARGRSDDRIQGHSDGADTYLAKPFRSEELLAAVDSLLMRQQRIREAEVVHQDEAMVFMASGMLEHIQRAVGSLLSVQGAVVANASPSLDTTRRLQESVGQLADVAASLRELTTVGSQPVVRPAAIDDALRSLAATTSEHLPKGRSLHVELQAPVTARVTEDELITIVRPMLERAINVTPMGRNIFLQTLTHRNLPQGRDAFTPSVSIIIRDEGPSLTPSQIERMFFPFHQTDCDVRGALELARARRIVLTRGGSIMVEPEPELGSRITVHLPLHEPLQTEVAA